MEKGFNKIGLMLLTIIIGYILWISYGLYNSYTEIEEMYSDVYEKRFDIEERVGKIVEIRKEQIYLEKESENLNN